jgi:transposase
MHCGCQILVEAATMSKVQVRPLRPYEGQKLVRMLRQSQDAIAVRRAEIVMRSAQGESAPEIAQQLYFTADYVRKVIHAFNEQGLEVLKAKYINGGRPKKVQPEHESQLVELALTPPNLTGQPFTHWSLEKLRDVAVLRGLIPNLSLETVRQILKDYHISLQRTKTWKESTDPQFEEKKTASRRCTVRRKKDASK